MGPVFSQPQNRPSYAPSPLDDAVGPSKLVIARLVTSEKFFVDRRVLEQRQREAPGLLAPEFRRPISRFPANCGAMGMSISMALYSVL